MKKLQTILIALTVLTGCAKNANTQSLINNRTANDTTMTATTNTLTYLALGDSYTIGESVSEQQSYPYQLTAALNAKGLIVRPPTIIATTGWTTDNLIDAINQSAINGKTYDFVTLLIGVNDQYQNLSQDNYKIKFQQVLTTAIAFTKGDASKVFVISIPDYGVTPFANGQEAAIGPQIDQFNAINKAISLKAGVHYLDITPESREAANNPTLIAGDGLHPSAQMYAAWVAMLEPMVETRLNLNK